MQHILLSIVFKCLCSEGKDVKMPKKGIHPEYHTINVKRPDGTTFQTRSTLGKKDEVITITLDIDEKTHPVWTGERRLVDTGGQLGKFKNRFEGYGI